MSEKNFVFDVKRQKTYSRGELLLRSFFGFFYITIPHLVCLGIINSAMSALSMYAKFAVLFTGKYPELIFELLVRFMKWQARLSARNLNLLDGYPEFGFYGEEKNITFEVKYPKELDQVMVAVRIFFGFFYVLIPHGFILLFRNLWGGLLKFVAWFTVLFTGEYPQGIFEFLVANQRWSYRVSLYMMAMTDEYPKFSGKA